MSEATCKFELGDVVRLKSGGQAMTVEDINPTARMINGKQTGMTFNVKCVWMPDRPGHGPWKRESFPDHVLASAQPDAATMATMRPATVSADGKDKRAVA